MLLSAREAESGYPAADIRYALLKLRYFLTMFFMNNLYQSNLNVYGVYPRHFSFRTQTLLFVEQLSFA